MGDNEFFTFREYMRKGSRLSASMEDYLEMIYRLCREKGYARTIDLATALNVQPSSTTRMIQKMSDLKLVNYEKYGVITLSPEGKAIGEALLKRHMVIEEFLRLIGVGPDLLKETEKIEHTISDFTLGCLAKLTMFFRCNPEIEKSFRNFQIDNEVK